MWKPAVKRVPLNKSIFKNAKLPNDVMIVADKLTATESNGINQVNFICSVFKTFIGQTSAPLDGAYYNYKSFCARMDQAEKLIIAKAIEIHKDPQKGKSG